ncbi:uncharacterized protein PFL1_02278 [Pseudozyma flocculosa PF-1]|uniref:Chloride channel protein n=1 Tax=Pseudozyma flocculosa TaxID=84751 RepID=A0A5C3F6A2_9BASI|nr:uncharacterized protein PFL1_02278 [Pseudozyma flocculosa PF-1]EPQ30162.1 hypothetical protein PFL1_02278 [Pseudozyma flocculosa PF-1]SPO39912.1 probable Probable chloride channel protein UM03490-D [Pseudozyma flocculosa]
MSDSQGLTPTTPTFPPGSRRRPRAPEAERNDATAARANEDDEALDEIRRYESFSTVDWIVDGTRERNRLAREREAESIYFSNAQLANGGEAAWGRFGFGRAGLPPRWWSRGPWGRRLWLIWGVVKSALSAFTDSGVVVLVGIIIGLNMGMISLATEWASDLKQGYCSSGWWLNQKFCCWEMMDPAGPGGAPIPAAAKAVAATTATASLAAPSLAADATKSALGTAATSGTAANLTARLVERWDDAGGDLLLDTGRQVVRRGLGGGLSLLSRAEEVSTPAMDLSETCTDWVPWSHWTVPAFLVYLVFACLLAATGAHLVRSFAPYAAGSGISEIKCILAGFVINGYLGFGTLAIKSLTLPLAIASGLSVGKEGPAVHVACCIGNVVAGYFRSFNRSQAKMRELLTAASAAGVAVAFGSPIGGVLFSLEEMAHNFPASTMWRSFLCALAATVTLSFINPFRTGKLVLFQVSYDRDWHYFEILFYIIIGVFGGLYGAFVIKYNLQVQSFRRSNLAQHGLAEAVVLAALTAFIGYGNKFLRIDMTESLEILFRECEGGGDYDNLCQSWAQWRMVNSLLLATVLRIALVIISYGCKVPAGIFVPSMAIGATFGRMIGILVKALYNAFPDASLFSACRPDVPCITPGTYAFLGAAAALAGVTRITVAVVVIMFELTGALTYILPTMLVVGITKGVGDYFGKGGIAEQMIKFSGYPFLDKDEHAFGIPVHDVMKTDPVTLNADGMPLSELEAKLEQASYKGFPVVASRNDATLLGYAGKMELRYAIAKARRARALSPQTICMFTIPIDNGDDGDLSAHLRPNDDLNDVPSNETTAAASHGSGTGRAASMLQHLGRGASLTAGGSGDRRQREAESLIGQLGEDGMGDDDDGFADGLGRPDDGLGEASGGVDGEGDEDVIELAGWIDQTPLIVQPAMALEVVMDLFKKLGPRVILVARFGRLSGLVTVKDVLKKIAAQEKAEANAAAAAAAAAAQRLPSTSSGHGMGLAQHDAVPSGELEALLNEASEWVRAKYEAVRPHIDPVLSRLGLSGVSRRSGSGGGRGPSGRARYTELGGEDTEESGIALDSTRSSVDGAASRDAPRRGRDGGARGDAKDDDEQAQFVLGDE